MSLTASRAAAAALLLLAAAAVAQPSPEDRALYDEWCARCHGERGDGRGPAGVSLAFNGRPPRDFTGGQLRFRSTRSGTGATDADLRRTIEHGLPGTGMPYFADLLSREEIDRLVTVVRSFARTALPVGEPMDLGPEPPSTPEARGRGRRLYVDLGCPACHGRGGDGREPTAPDPDLRNDDGSVAQPADLRRPWALRGGSEARDIALRLATGLAGTPMPAYLDSATIADLWDVAHYIRSLALAPSLRAAAIAQAKLPPGEGEAPRARGEYLAKSGTCFLCHVQMQDDGTYREGSFGAGGMKVEIRSFGTVSTRNLTPDRETGLGGWTSQDLRRALKRGQSRDGRRLGVLDMPWTILSALDDRDVDALHAYLASLPRVRNALPVPAAPGPVDGIVRKILMVARGEQAKAGFHPGNTGRADAAAVPAVNSLAPRTALLATAVALLVAVASLRRRRAVATLAAAIAVLGWIYLWPPLEFLPVGMVSADPEWQRPARIFNFPPLRRPPAPAGIDDPDLRALAERGRYVATVGTCPLCHTAGPSLTRLYAPFPEMGGGMRVNWRIFGTTFSRNLTPDRATGLGAWSDAEIRRALTSGISRDGRLMHWQAMPWDHFSNLTLEDQEALTFYLRSLPPVWSKVPDPLPPAPDDEPADTFFFGYSGEYRP